MSRLKTQNEVSIIRFNTVGPSSNQRGHAKQARAFVILLAVDPPTLARSAVGIVVRTCHLNFHIIYLYSITMLCIR